MLVIILILAGIILRVMPHAPNFTPVAAIALFGGAYLSKKYSIIVPLSLMAISDIFLGMHNVVIFTWGGFVLAALLGTMLKKQKSVSKIAGASILSSLIFYIVSNFGVWLMGWYPHTLSGLVNCYVLALPFLRDFMLSTLIYSAAFFGIYEFVASKVKDTKLASVLLTK